MGFPVYEDTKFLIDGDIKLKWEDINDIFSGTFEEDLEDHKLYVNIHKYGLYRIACRYPSFPCAEMIHWIVSHTDPETMTLSSLSGTKIATFRAHDYQWTYHFSTVITMETPLNIPSNNANSRDILKR